MQICYGVVNFKKVRLKMKNHWHELWKCFVRICPNCKGKGTRYNIKCNLCNGWGEIKEDKNA